ncbi:MAG TPA: hypothetical protein VF175_15500 [Lacipirellula sp.]
MSWLFADAPFLCFGAGEPAPRLSDVGDLPIRADGDLYEAVATVGKWTVCQARDGSWYRVEG